MKKYLEAAEIVTTHGLKGEIKLYPLCDDISFLEDFTTLYLDSEGKIPVTIEQLRYQKQMGILKLQGIDTVEDAVKLRKKILYINREDTTLEDGEFFIQDLIGLKVVDADDGRVYGTLTDVSQTGANDVYHITFEDGIERLIPAIKQVVITTEPERGVMTIRPLKGLFDDAD